MKYTVVALVLVSIFGNASWATARPNPVTYSYKIWPHGRLARGQTATATTPFGALTCSGGGGYDASGQRKGAPSPRSCHW